MRRITATTGLTTKASEMSLMTGSVSLQKLTERKRSSIDKASIHAIDRKRCYVQCMNKLLLCGICLLAWSVSPAQAQTAARPPAAAVPADGSDVVVVKVVEDAGSLRLDIARATGPHEQRNYRPRDLSDYGPGAAELTRQLLAQLAREGYALTTTYGGGERYGNRNTLVFTQRP